MTKEPEWQELPPIEYLRDLSERILHIPVKHGVDGYDYDRLREIARKIDEGEALK